MKNDQYTWLISMTMDGSSLDQSPPSSPFHGYQTVEGVQTAAGCPPEQPRCESPDDSPFYGFCNADIPQPIVIKTEPVDGNDDSDDVVIVEVRKASKPAEFFIKKEILDDDDDEEEENAFHGFAPADIPRPIIIKEEPEEELSVHRAETAPFQDHLFLNPEVPVSQEAPKLPQPPPYDIGVGPPAAYSPGKSPFRPISPDLSGPAPVKRVASAAAFVDMSGAEQVPSTPVGLLAVAAETLFQKPVVATTITTTEVSGVCAELTAQLVEKGRQPDVAVASSETASQDLAGFGDSQPLPQDIVTKTAHTTINFSTSEIHPKTDSKEVNNSKSISPVAILASSASNSSSEPTVPGLKITGDVEATDRQASSHNGESAAEEAATVAEPIVLHCGEVEMEQEEEAAAQVLLTAGIKAPIQEDSEGSSATAAISRPDDEKRHDEQNTDSMQEAEQSVMIIVEDSSSIGDGEGAHAHTVAVETEEVEEGGQVVQVMDEHDMMEQHDGGPAVHIISLEAAGAGAAAAAFASLKPKVEHVPASPGTFIQSRMVNQYNAPSSQITIFETSDLMDGRLEMKHEIEASTNRLPRKIQILDENGENIVLMTNEDDDDDDSDDSDDEDREFTVIVDDEEEVEEEGSDEGGIGLDQPQESKRAIEAESIEDILAQFEAEPASKTVSCPNCRKYFVSQHFLNLHVSNSSTMCELCTTQCCTAANLRNHRNLECDLAKRKRNIDLIAQETALLGRKPIEPEKYYNLPIESSDEESETVMRKPVKSVNDQKYECGICGLYVKILDSHMKFIHGLDGARGSKYKCQECGVLVSDIAKHRNLRHDPSSKIIISDLEPDVVRCKYPGCDMFFNNLDEATEHQKREHSDEVRLACGMGGCNAVFDNRGSLRKHRSDAHPELDEFRPVDLEPDDPDRESDLTVACPVCEKKFKHKNTCTVHIKVHHLGWCKRKLFECPDCYKSFENKKAMDMHRESIHLGIRTVCPLCEKPVTRLDLHVRMVHTELPEWPCPDCGKKFKRKFDLNRHRVTVHLGVRNFPCDLCGKRFADMKDMTRHKNAVHYGMKIKWNSRRHKEERMRQRERGERGVKYRSQKREERRGRRGVPVEFMETVETSNGSSHQIHLEEGGGETVLLDPLLQSQLAAVQGNAGDARVLIEADPDSSGGLRFVVIQDENGMVEDDEDEEDDEEDERYEEDDDEDDEYDENELVVEQDEEC